MKTSICLTDQEARCRNLTCVIRPFKEQVPDWVSEFCFSALAPEGHIGGYGIHPEHGPAYKWYKMPYHPGQELSVREAWLTYPHVIGSKLMREGAYTWPFVDGFPFQFATEDGQLLDLGWVRRSPAAMPIKFSRRTLRITSVACKLVSVVTEEEAKGCGFETIKMPPVWAHDSFRADWCKRYPKLGGAWIWVFGCEWVKTVHLTLDERGMRIEESGGMRRPLL